MTLPTVNEATIASHATAKSFQRGASYYQEGAVTALFQRGNTLIANVEGSEYNPYRVSIQFDKGGLTDVACTCPYDFGGWCKHIVAALLEAWHHPESIEQRHSLSELLQPLTRHQLQTLLEDLSAEQPGLIETIEDLLQPADNNADAMAAQLTARPISQPVSQPVARRTPVDPQPFRRQVAQIIYQGTGDWDDSPALYEIRDLIKQADDFTDKGDGQNALAILEAIIDAYRETWMNLDGSSGESGLLFYDFDVAFAEALLTAPITTDDQVKWQEILEIWEEDAEDYGIDQAFAKSQGALTQGWDDPELIAILQGDTTDGSELEEPVSPGDYTLAQIRLDILKRQERNEEFLNLAKAKGCAEEYLTMLVQLNRLELAIAQAPQYLDNPTTALSVAQALRAKGALEPALKIAESGLSLPGYGKARLAEWTSELAEGLGHTDTSLQTRIAAFSEIPTLADYLKIQELAEPTEWPKLKKKLLTRLRKEHAFFIQAAVDIFLREGLLGDAIKVVDQCSSYNSVPIRQVMEAAMVEHSDWVMTSARRHAESIMDGGKAKYYHHAVDWLKLAHRAYMQAEQPKKWKVYYTKLRQKHTRKRKLMDLLHVFE